MSGYRWVSIRKGDAMPGRTVLAGQNSADGANFVIRVNNEAGKLNLDGGKVNNFWCHHGGKSESGEILVVDEGYQASWEYKKKGDGIPDGAVLAGSNSSDGDNYACRNANTSGKVTQDKGRINNYWMHGAWFAKEDGDVCCVRRVGGDQPQPTPSQPQPTPPQPQHDDYHPEFHPPAGDHPYSTWNPDADCAGVRAEDRMRWLMDNKGMPMDDARSAVMQEFPFQFREGHGKSWWEDGIDCGGSRAGDRAKWLMENQGLSETAARVKVKSEFPQCFQNGGGDFVDCKFPHSLSLVDTPSGPRLKIDVVCNHDNVALVAFHYQVNGGAPMNFDVRQPEAGKTFSHRTPDGGGYPLCRNGDQVSYWLAAEINGLIAEEPEGACPNPAARMHWTAHH